MRRFGVILVAAAALAAGCGSGGGDDVVPGATTTGPTKAQLAAREKLLAEIRAGTFKCYCNSALRARERIEEGLVEAP